MMEKSVLAQTRKELRGEFWGGWVIDFRQVLDIVVDFVAFLTDCNSKTCLVLNTFSGSF